jgi:hypothetical protein
VRLLWGSTGLVELNHPTPDSEGDIFLERSTSLVDSVGRLVSLAGSDARILDVTTTGVVSDKPIPEVTFRIVPPQSGITRPADLIVLRASFKQTSLDTTLKQQREALLIAFHGRPPLETFFPLTHRPQPSIAAVKQALDTIAATFTPGPQFVS